MAKDMVKGAVSNGSSDNTDNTANDTGNDLVGIRSSIHPELFKRLEKAEYALHVERGVVIDMALNALFSLPPQERANLLDRVTDERSKLVVKAKTVSRDFNF